MRTVNVENFLGDLFEFAYHRILQMSRKEDNGLDDASALSFLVSHRIATADLSARQCKLE